MLIPLTRSMAQGPMSREREERLAEIERLTTIGIIALRRLWKLLPDPDTQIPKMPPAPMKPGQLRRLAARMRAGLVPPGVAPDMTAEEVEKMAVYQRRAIWCWHKMRAIEARLKPLWAATRPQRARDWGSVAGPCTSLMAPQTRQVKWWCSLRLPSNRAWGPGSSLTSPWATSNLKFR